MDKKKEIQHKVFQIPNKSRITRRDSRKDTGHSLDLEMKRNEMELTVTLLKENGFHCRKNGEAIRGIGSSSIQEHQCFESCNSEKEEPQRLHTLHCGCSRTQLFYRTVHLANQLSIYGAVVFSGVKSLI